MCVRATDARRVRLEDLARVGERYEREVDADCPEEEDDGKGGVGFGLEEAVRETW